MTGSQRRYTLREIVERFGGEIVGDGELPIARVATLENADAESIAFLANARYRRHLETTRAGAVIVGRGTDEAGPRSRIVCDNPYVYFARVSALFNPPRPSAPGIDASACVHPDAHVDATAEVQAHAAIARGARIGARSVIGAGSAIGENVCIGRDARIHAGVTIYDGCVLGDRVVVHAGAVIGADGFGIAFDEDHWVKVPQVGRVRVGNDVEIGANTTIDRGAIDDTVIEDGAKLDNQIQVAHNVHIGAHTAIAACTGIAGSARIGRYCRIGGGVGIAGHVTIADNVEVSGYTAVTKSIDNRGSYSGVYPFEANREWRRNAAQLRHLAEMARRVADLEKRLDELTRERHADE